MIASGERRTSTLINAVSIEIRAAVSDDGCDCRTGKTCKVKAVAAIDRIGAGRQFRRKRPCARHAQTLGPQDKQAHEMPVQKKQRKAKSTLKANLGSAFRCRNQSGASEYVHGLSFRGAATATRQNKETFHKSKGHLKKRFSNKDFLNCGLCAPTFA